MTVSYNKVRCKWVFDFWCAGKRYQGYCTLPDMATPASCRLEAKESEDREKKTARASTSQDLRGFVYIFASVTAPIIKIGWSRAPRSRLQQLNRQSPLKLKMVGCYRGTRRDERTLHNRISHLRADREWFQRTDESIAIIELALAQNRTNSLTGGPLQPFHPKTEVLIDRD